MIASRRKTNETDARGFTIEYNYDDANRLLIIQEPLGKVTSYEYDMVGNPMNTIDLLGK